MEKARKSLEQGSSSSAADATKLFQRVFSEDDEVIILQGLASKDLNSDSKNTDVYNYFKDILSFKPSQHQLKEKIRKLKTKFDKKVKRRSPIFRRQHDIRLFNLSKKVWIPEKEDLDDIGLHKMFKRGRDLLDKTKKAEFDERWKKLKLLEINFRDYRSAFFKDLSNIISYR